MYDSIRSVDPVVSKLPVPNPLVIVFITLLWLTLACALPLYQVNQERRRAHQELSHVLNANKSDQTSVIVAFDQANKNLDAAATGPCLLLACTIIFLVNQLLKLKRRYNALADEMDTSRTHRPRFRNASEG